MIDATEHSRVAGRLRKMGKRGKIFVDHLRKHATNTEKALWDLLRKDQILGLRFRRQHKIGKFVVDFFSIKCRLAIEVDGEIHLYQEQEDAARTRWLESLGIRVLRFANSQVFGKLEFVRDKIEKTAKQCLEKSHTQIPPPLQRGGGVAPLHAHGGGVYERIVG